MRSTKNVLGLIAALIPVLWFGGLAIYFNHIRDLGRGWFDGALGPTVIGLSALTLLFVALFVWKLRRLAAPPAPPSSGSGRMDAAPEEEKSDFDPDAALARYMARRASGGAGGQTGFGRKGA